MKIKKVIQKIFFILIFVLIIPLFAGLVFAQNANVTTTVEVNLLGFSNNTTTEDVSIWVPDHIFLGNVTKEEPVSKEITIFVNNTGRLPITVTPQLKDIDESIFSYLFFRTQKSDQDNILNISKRIGEYSLNINKPAAGKKYSYKRCHIRLDLTDFDGEIKEDLIGYKSEILFLAMPQ